MQPNLQDWQSWTLQNLQMLSNVYGKDNVVLDGKTWQTILIRNFVLPPNWKQRTSKLLIILPKKSQIFYCAPERFYLDWNLRAINNELPGHYFEDDTFNDMQKYKLARFSFHLTDGWRPSKNCPEGTNLTHVISGLFKGMTLGAKEVLS